MDRTSPGWQPRRRAPSGRSRQQIVRRLTLAIGIFAFVLLAGTVGYMVIEGWRFLDALFMTVTTISTVGYGEVHPLSPAGQVFTLLLIVSGVGTLGFAFASFVDFLVEGHLRDLLEGRRMSRSIESLSGHTVVAGLGRVGTEVARSFERESTAFVVIDHDQEAVDHAADAGWLALLGDATDDDVLHRAGIEKAANLVTALDSDADNVFVALTARTLNPAIFIVARATAATAEDRLRKAGADRVTTPSIIGGRRMASLVMHPLVSDYLDLVTHGDDYEFQLEEFQLTEGGAFADKTVRDARLHDDYGIFVLAVRHRSGTIEAKPTAETVLHAGDRVVLLGTAEQFKALGEVL